MLQYGARRRCFLSIGIEDYAFRPLKHAEKDAEVLAFKFQTRNYRTQISCNSPDRDALDRQIQDFGRQCVDESTEVIVVYFAGYAMSGRSSRVRLQLQRAQHPEDVDVGRTIGVDELMDSMLRLPTRRNSCFVLAVLDCGHSLIDANLQQSCTHGLMGPWATLWSSRTDEALDGIETGYGALVCGMLHHMVMEPQLNLQEICLRLDEHVAASTSNGQRVDVFFSSSTGEGPLIFSQEVWNPQSMTLSSIGRLRSSSSQVASWGWRRCSSCSYALASLCCTRNRILYGIYILLAAAILVLLILLALRSHRSEIRQLTTWTD
eukprot:s185_g14.t1